MKQMPVILVVKIMVGEISSLYFISLEYICLFYPKWLLLYFSATRFTLLEFTILVDPHLVIISVYTDWSMPVEAVEEKFF